MTNDEFMYLAEHLTDAPYQFAKSMPNNPHWYTLRRKWKDDDAFMKCADLINTYGYELVWWRRAYTCFDINGFRYWAMGEPRDDGSIRLTLINRTQNHYPSDYDDIASTYDTMFTGKEYKEEDAHVIDMINICEGDSVLDIGCGTGLLLDYLDIHDYVGIDPSIKMLNEMQKKHPYAFTINTDFEHFYTHKKFDKIVALYGVASYIEPQTIERVKEFLNDDGRAFLMFYKNGYKPVTYQKANKYVEHYNFHDDMFKGEEYHNYEIVEVTK